MQFYPKSIKKLKLYTENGKFTNNDKINYDHVENLSLKFYHIKSSNLYKFKNLKTVHIDTIILYDENLNYNGNYKLKNIDDCKQLNVAEKNLICCNFYQQIKSEIMFAGETLVPIFLIYNILYDCFYQNL